jgi:hypothetical protein
VGEAEVRFSTKSFTLRGRSRKFHLTVMTRFATALLISCLFTVGAIAADVRIGEMPIALPSLPGHCEMDVVHASDAPLIAKLHASVQKSGHRLLLLSADCKELKEWRGGKRAAIAHMAEYQTALAFERSRPPDEPEKIINAFCDQMDAMANEPSAKSMAIIQERGEQAVKLIRTNEIKFLGAVPVKDEPMVCYAATVHKFTVEAGDEYTQGTIIATMLLKGKVLLCYLFAPYVGRETLTQILVKQRANVRQLQRANR